MERIKDGRRNILIHGNASESDIPVEGLPEIPAVASAESFVPANMNDPKLYPGDVIVGVNGEEISFAELIYDKVEGGVLVIPLDTGIVELISDADFSKRFFQRGEIHVYDSITEEIPEWDVEFDESQVERPQTRRAR